MRELLFHRWCICILQFTHIVIHYYTETVNNNNRFTVQDNYTK